MKPKLHPIYIIVALFLLKVGVIDNFRNFGHHTNSRMIASEGPAAHDLKPIR
jgi:hypothetical protein